MCSGLGTARYRYSCAAIRCPWIGRHIDLLGSSYSLLGGIRARLDLGVKQNTFTFFYIQCHDIITTSLQETP